MDDFFYSSTPPFTAFMVNLYMQSTSQEVAGKDLEENEFAPGRQAVVSIAGDQLIVQDSAHPADRLYVASSEIGTTCTWLAADFRSTLATTRPESHGSG